MRSDDSVRYDAVDTAQHPARECVTPYECQPVEQLIIDTGVYTLEALFRTCYAFTDRCYLFLRRTGPNEVTVEFRQRQKDIALADAVGAFGNELIDQRVRADLAKETSRIREWIVAQAFVEADLPGPHPLVHLEEDASADDNGALSRHV